MGGLINCNQCKYIMDASSILAQKDNDKKSRSIYRSLWNNIDNYITNGIIVICSEIENEIQDDDLQKWLKSVNCIVLESTIEVQNNVKTIVNEPPYIVDIKNGKSSGDPFLIATAQIYSLIVITEENQMSPKKIPKICEKYNIPCVNIDGLCKSEKWIF